MTTSVTKLLCSLAGSILLSSWANAQPSGTGQGAPVDKGLFHLFNPTPSQYLREMTIDGPGATESPYTVDAGHFQIEMYLIKYAVDQESFDGQTRHTRVWSIAPMNLKLGLLNRLDAQLLIEPYNGVREHEAGITESRRGFADTTVRLKYNLWGNDSGWTAFAATPYVRFPTSQNGLGRRGIGAGVVLPLDVALPLNFYLGLTTRFEAARGQDQRGYHPEFINSIAVEHELIENLAGYVEFFSAVTTEAHSDWVGTFDTGLTYRVTRNLQLNAGVNIGVTRPAEDWNPFFSLAVRF